tara:strand:+ start:34 stop:1206 length:1173 start_codon:yes stop_codon:yes gene_type:complete
MNELDTLIENYFTDTLETSDIFQLVEEAMGIVSNSPVRLALNEQEDAAVINKNITIEDILGTLAIDIKNWGTRNENATDDAMDRKIVQQYVQALGVTTGEPDDILQALANSFDNLNTGPVDRKEGTCELAKVVATIQLLNTLSRIINQFEPRAAGFINEAFLSALFPGGGVVAAEDSEGIEDFKVVGAAGDVHYSLKTIATGQGFDGSKIDLVKSMRASSQNEVIYYVFGKVGGKGGESVGTIYTHKLVIDESNIEQILGGKASYQTTLKQIEKGNPKWDPSLHPEGASFGSKPGTFKVPSKLYYNDEHLIATLTIDNAKLMEIAKNHLKEIIEQLVEIQQQFKQVVANMNAYLSTMSNTKAEEFKRKADAFNGAVQTNVKGDDTCTPPD